MALKSVLIPIDQSECSMQTLQWISDSFMDKENYQFFLLEVIPHVYSEIPMEPFQIEGAEASLKKARHFLESAGYRVTKSEYILGDPADRICEVAEDLNADLVLMGSHGKSGISKIIMGSVSSDVLARCKQPVLIYRNIKAK